jgi:hypothetical protein
MVRPRAKSLRTVCRVKESFMSRKLSVLYASLPCLVTGLLACGADAIPELGIIKQKGNAELPPFAKIERPAEAVPSGPFTCSLSAGQDEMGATKVITLSDENNYKFSNKLNITNTKVKAKSNIYFDWSELTTGFLGHALNPKLDIESLVIALFPWPHQELADRLGADQVGDNDTAKVVTLFPRKPTQNIDEPKTAEGFTSHDLLTDVNFNQVPVTREQVEPNLDADPVTGFDPAQYTWAILAQKGDLVPAPPGVVQMIASFTLDPASGNTSVKIDNNSTIIQYDTMLQQWHPVFVPSDLSSVAFRWASLTKNGMGISLNGALGVRKLFIAHYKESPKELEEQFLKLDTPGFALEEYTNSTPLAFNEGSARLSDFKTSNGKTFTGVTDDGTWLVGINCDICKSPAPSYLGILKPCAGG